MKKLIYVVIMMFALVCLLASCSEHTHEYSEWENITNPTCTVDGSKVRYCTCGEEQIKPIYAIGHTEVIDTAVEATCTAGGLTEGKHCSACNEVIVAQNPIDALGHTEVIDAAVEPTCVESGLMEGKHCSVCDEITLAQTIVDALGHTWAMIEDGHLYCLNCGFENENDFDDNVILEDLSSQYGNGTNYVVGYYVYDSLQFSYYVSIILDSGEEIVLNGINFIESDKPCTISFSTDEVENALASKGLSFDDGDIRFVVVPNGSDGTIVYAITFAPSIDVDKIPFGNKVGDRCQSYALDLIDGSGKISIADLKGKIVIINFWGTWCTPCVQELPHFDQIASDYDGDVAVLTVHSYAGVNLAPEFIEKNFPNSKMIFAADACLTGSISMYFTLLGGTNYYPRTVIIDENGIIAFTKDGAINYAKLVEVIEGIKATR